MLTRTCHGRSIAPVASEKQTPHVCVRRYARSTCRSSGNSTAQSSSKSAQAAQHISSGTTFHHGITYVSYEGNSFWVKFNNTGARVLVDPWLVGDLQFFDQGWLYTGKKRGFGGSSGVHVDLQQVADDTDVILISQWVDDHTHIPTLSTFPKHIPIIAHPEAADRIRPLGFQSLTTIKPGQGMQLCGGKLQLTATAGALVGPPWSARQNGFVLRELDVDAPTSLYYEPHCDFVTSSVSAVGQVDVVVSPVQSVLLGGYPLLKGDSDIVQLLKLLKPKVLIPLLNAGTLEESGQLTPIMSVKGSSAAAVLRQRLAEAGLAGTKLEYPAPPGESLAVAL